jgi:hypothetical protein
MAYTIIFKLPTNTIILFLSDLLAEPRKILISPRVLVTIEGVSIGN